MQITSKILLFAVLTSGGLLAACDDDDEDNILDDEDLAALRIVHASPGAPAVDVFTAGSSSPLATIEYVQASPYVLLPEDGYTLVVRVAGTDTFLYETPRLDFQEEDVITAIVAGDVASTDPADSFRVIPLWEEFDVDVAGQTRVRIVHASPDAPTVDIDVGDDGAIDIPSLDRFEKGLCTACHMPHASPVPKLLRDKMPAVCFQCHSKTHFEGRSTCMPR